MRYDFKDELLQITDFCCEDCLTNDIIQSILYLRQYEGIEIYAKAELIELLITEFLGSSINGNEITIGKIEFDGIQAEYDDEYVLTIDDNYKIWCFPAMYYDEKNDECRPMGSDALLAYVYQEDCRQSIIDKLKQCGVPTLLFGFDEE